MLPYEKLDTILKVFFLSKLPADKIHIKENGDSIITDEYYYDYAYSFDAAYTFRYSNPGDKYADNYLKQAQHNNDLFYINNQCYDLDMQRHGYIGPYVLYKGKVFFMSNEEIISDTIGMKRAVFGYFELKNIRVK